MKQSDIARLVEEYVQHLDARIRASGKATSVVLPAQVSDLCTNDPKSCLDLILRTLERDLHREAVRAVGDELLENLLNENSAAIADEVANELKNNKRFRQAFAFGNHASVDPTLTEEWAAIFQRLGTTKAAERKSLGRKN